MGFAGEIAGHSGSQQIGTTDADLKYHTFLFGPKLVHRDGKVEMLLKMLVGAARAAIDSTILPGGNDSAADFAYGLGR